MCASVVGQLLDGLRERYFGAPLEFKTHDHVSVLRLIFVS